jgi:predicted amidohydrolase YtcJ
VDEKIPSPPLDEKAALTAAELKRMSAYGITSLMDAFVTPAEEAVWRKLYDTGRLPMRVRTAIYVADPSDDSDEAVARLIAASRQGDVDPRRPPRRCSQSLCRRGHGIPGARRRRS